MGYSRHPMPFSDTGVQAIYLSWQSDPLNSLPHSAFWLLGTIYAGVLSRSMSLSMKDSFWSSIMSNNLPQSAAWLFPNSPSQSIIRLFCPLSTVGLSSLGFLFMKDPFLSFIIVQTIFLSWQPDCFQILSTLQCHLYWWGFLPVRPFQISTVGPSSLGFILSTSQCRCLILEFKQSASVGNLIL